MAWLTRLFRRASYEPCEPPETPATIKAHQASEQLAATDQRIDRTLRALQERDDGGFLEHSLWPDLPSYPRSRRERPS